jgi:hypothetical protein
VWPFLLPPLALAAPDTVTLRVGVHRDAGGIVGVAADGAAGQCAVNAASLSCPALGPVTFRWGPSDGYELVGDAVLEPGQTGTAFVLRPEDAATLDRLRSDVLADDPLVRRAAVEALHEWTWAAGYGPLPSTGPVPVPPGWLLERLDDRDWRVRRALVDVSRDFRDHEREAEVEEVLLALAADRNPKVRRAGLAALGAASREDLVDPIAAWERALAAVEETGGRGRAAAGTLAKLSTVLDAPQVDPVVAVERTLAYHPEQAWRVWGAWRNEVPLRRDWLELLLKTTHGLHRGLLRDWAARDPAGLQAVVQAWEPTEPHSDRWRVIQLWIADPLDG